MHFPAFRVSAVLSAASLAACLAVLAPGEMALAQQPQQHTPATGEHPPATGVARPGGAASTAAKEDHPKMEAALKDLDKAKSELESAVHDFDGHRKKALELANQASEQVRQGLASDK